MKNDSIDGRMRALELFHDLRIAPGAWSVIRVDGRGFTRLSNEHFQRPFDVRFHEMMLRTTEALLTEFHALYAFTESDEISVLLPADTDLFGREVEKLVSISAGIASATFSLQLGKPAHFDSRIWVGSSRSDVVDYFRWRHSDAARCCLNGWCYWTLRAAGLSVTQATGSLDGRSFEEKIQLLSTRGIDYGVVPNWQKYGVALYWEEIEKHGHNPLTGAASTTIRRRLRVDRELPEGSAYEDLLARILGKVAIRA